MIRLISAAIAVMLTITAAEASQHRDCPGDYKFAGQKAQGQAHNDVERAGVILCKNYGKDQNVPNDRYAVLLGHDRHQKLWNFQAGGIEKHHKYTTETASAELMEETGGLIKYSAGQIRHLPFICAGKKQLFFLYNPADHNIGVRALRKSCQAAVKNKKLPHCMREVDDAVDVSVIELLRVAKLIKDEKLPKQSTYTLYGRHGQQLQVSGFYMRTVAKRYDEARVIFNQVFGVNIF